MPRYCVENHAAQQVCNQLLSTLMLSPDSNLNDDETIIIGSINFILMQVESHASASLIIVTRIANLLVAFRCNSSLQNLVGELLLRIATYKLKKPISCRSLMPLKIQHSLVVDSPNQAIMLAVLIKKAYTQRNNGPAFFIAWIDIKSNKCGTQVVDRALLIEESHSIIDVIGSPLQAAQDISANRHFPLNLVGQTALSNFGSFPVSLFSKPKIDYDMPIPSASAEMHILGFPSIITLGRSTSNDRAEIVAALEALERYAGLFSKPPKEILISSFKELSNQAINPELFGLHPEQSYCFPGFPYPRFTDDLLIDWVWAENISKGTHVAVPACFAFYGGTSEFPRIRLAFDSSNGCALGASRKEATLHAIFELIERDAFLLSWYKQSLLENITAAVCRNDHVRWSCERIAFTTETRILILKSTKEHHIPSVIIVALAKDVLGPQMAISTGCGLTYADAAISGLNEIAGHLFFLKQMFKNKDLITKAYRMLDHPDEVLTMEDHGFVNALPESLHRSHCLWEGAPEIDEAQLQADEIHSFSVEESLQLVLVRLKNCQLEVYTIAHSSQKLSLLGLYAQRALIPGLLPMTFGFRNRRLRLSRIGNEQQQMLAEAMPPHPFM